MNKWKKYKLGELAQIIGGGTPKTTVEEYWNGDIPWLSVVDFGKSVKTVYNTEKTITDKGLKESSTKILEKGQLIISARGTVGELAMLGRDMAFNQSCYGLTASRETTNDFLYYLIKVSVGKIKQNTHGAVFDTITKQTFENIEVTIPESLETQQKIAQILSSLDDKIEINLQMNKTLEAMAQAIFKEWFVKFNFPDFDFLDFPDERDFEKKKEKKQGNQENPKNHGSDNLPKGWRKEPIDKNIEFLNGLALQKFPALNEDDFLPVIKIRELKQGLTSASNKASAELPVKYVIYDGDILFSWSGSLEVVLWCEGKGALNQHLFKVTSTVYPKWFYFFWVREYLPLYKSIAEGKATTMGHIQRRHLTDTIINVPNKELMNLTDSILSPFFEKIKENSCQIQSLTKIRDTLLPKLMSGQLEVKL